MVLRLRAVCCVSVWLCVYVRSACKCGVFVFLVRGFLSLIKSLLSSSECFLRSSISDCLVLRVLVSFFYRLSPCHQWLFLSRCAPREAF